MVVNVHRSLSVDSNALTIIETTNIAVAGISVKANKVCKSNMVTPCVYVVIIDLGYNEIFVFITKLQQVLQRLCQTLQIFLSH